MARDAALFEVAGGSPLRGYLLLKQNGSNVPASWIERAERSRRDRHVRVAAALKRGGAAAIVDVEDWELAYRKECFYRGIRILFDLERNGRTRL